MCTNVREESRQNQENDKFQEQYCYISCRGQRIVENLGKFGLFLLAVFGTLFVIMIFCKGIDSSQTYQTNSVVTCPMSKAEFCIREYRSKYERQNKRLELMHFNDEFAYYEVIPNEVQ